MNVEDKINRARKRVIETIAQNMNLYGVSSSVGRLYGVMSFYDKPLTLDEMKDVLGMSKTSMSTSIRTLVDLKLVEKVWEKGVRKDLYVVEEDWYESFTSLLSIKGRHAVALNKSAIRKSLREIEALLQKEELEKDLIVRIEKDIAKLTYALEYYTWMDRLIDSFENKEIFNYIPKKAEK